MTLDMDLHTRLIRLRLYSIIAAVCCGLGAGVPDRLMGDVILTIFAGYLLIRALEFDRLLRQSRLVHEHLNHERRRAAGDS